jgi:hypothetical protein
MTSVLVRRPLFVCDAASVLGGSAGANWPVAEGQNTRSQGRQRGDEPPGRDRQAHPLRRFALDATAFLWHFTPPAPWPWLVTAAPQT